SYQTPARTTAPRRSGPRRSESLRRALRGDVYGAVLLGVDDERAGAPEDIDGAFIAGEVERVRFARGEVVGQKAPGLIRGERGGSDNPRFRLGVEGPPLVLSDEEPGLRDRVTDPDPDRVAMMRWDMRQPGGIGPSQTEQARAQQVRVECG